MTMLFFDPTVIRALRKTKKISLAELGRILDVSARTISAWENSEGRLSAKALADIANLFEVNTEIFFKTRRS